MYRNKLKDESPKSKMSNPLDRTSSLRISGRSKTHVVRNPLTSPKLLNETKISSSSLSDNKFDTSASHEKTAPKIYPEATPKKNLTRAAGEGDTLKSEGSRFCHECGAKYPVPMAKFCCNCGIRRISL